MDKREFTVVRADFEIPTTFSEVWTDSFARDTRITEVYRDYKCKTTHALNCETEILKTGLYYDAKKTMLTQVKPETRFTGDSITGCFAWIEDESGEVLEDYSAAMSREDMKKMGMEP